MATINNLQVNLDKKPRKLTVIEIQGKTARIMYFITRSKGEKSLITQR